MTKTIPVGNGPAAVAVNAAGAWVANAGDNSLVRVDTETNAVAGTTAVGDGPAAVLATPTALWVANGRDGTVMRLDPRSGKVSKTIRLGGTPTALASAGGQVWVAIAPAPPQAPPADGARLTDSGRLLVARSGVRLWPLYATCANLVTYPDKPAPEGSRIVPEVAEAVPDPTAGGTTYTFRIRPGFRFSPPSNEVVTAMTFKSTIERVANPRLRSPQSSRFSGIVGYQAYVRGKARGISGIVARGRTLTIRLSQPDGGFLANLAGGSACAVPRDTPAAGGINDIPSAGPYYIASYTPRQQVVLRRNPNYRGDRPAPSRLDRRRDRSRPRARPRAGRSRYGRLRSRAAARGWAAIGVDVRSRQRSCEGGTPAVLHQRGAGSAIPAHEHEQASLLGRAPAASRELRDRPAGPGGAGTKGRRGESLQRGRAYGRLPSSVRPRSRRTSSCIR